VPDAQLPDLYRSVDKFDKIGATGVRKELEQRGIAAEATARMMDLLQINTGSGVERLDAIEKLLGVDLEGVRELRALAEHLENARVSPENYEFDFAMVRGLSYYTGPIFETVITEPNLGSVTGGGRYDGLIGLFRRESLPTTGTSLGIERIIDLMDELKLYPNGIGGTVVQALVTVFNADTRAEATTLAAELRTSGINTELYLQDRNIGKQLAYADKKRIPIAAILGGDEIAAGTVKLKRLSDGTEVSVARAEAAAKIRALLS
jgi:histidyl-tRNA synthetase